MKINVQENNIVKTFKTMNPSAFRQNFNTRRRYQNTGKNKGMSPKVHQEKFHPTNSLEEIKILNVESNIELFMSVSMAFENVLNELEIKKNPENILETLIKIQNLLKTKISCLEKILKDKINIPENAFDHEESVSQSRLSLFSELSSSKVDESYKDFLKVVHCSFCAEPQSDLDNLVKHLDKQCFALMHDKLEKKEHTPFSVFQILPNNMFKCNVCPNTVNQNIRHYFLHTKQSFHISALRKVASKKKCSEFLFCSTCKIQVPNNFTQLSNHIQHESHTARCKITLNVGNLMKKKICCIYMKNKTFKCLVCTSVKCFYKTLEEIKNHLEKPINNSRYEALPQPMIMYCEICSKEVHFLKMRSHFITSEHVINEDKYLEKSYELCVFCNFKCDSLVELSQHVKSNCTAFNNYKEKTIKLESLDKQVVKKEKIEEKVVPEENDSKGHYIIVKGYENMPELLKYFKKFGEIEAIENYNEEDVLIKFSHKSSLDDVLLLHSMHSINGERIEIATEENFIKKTKGTEFLIKVEEKSTDSEDSDFDVSLTEKCSNNKYKDMDLSCNKHSEDETKLINLFERVAEHLMNSRQSLDSGKMLKIDVVETVRCGRCSVVGFLESELSFPQESIGLHVHTEEICDLVFDDVDSAIEDELVFHNDALLMSYRNMLSSEKWENVTLVKSEFYIPHIECVHKYSNKSCTLTFMRSAKILSLMLSDCVKENVLFRRFCLLIRFWVTVEKLKIKKFDYALISLLVYFFKSKNFVKKSFESFKKGTRAALLGKAILEKSRSVHSSPSDDNSKSSNVKEMYQEFVEFLHAFDFEKYAICLPLDYPVPRTFLTKKNSREIFSKSSDPDKLNNSPMCILDPFLCLNLASGIHESDMITFSKIVADSVRKQNFIK